MGRGEDEGDGLTKRPENPEGLGIKGSEAEILAVSGAVSRSVLRHAPDSCLAPPVDH